MITAFWRKHHLTVRVIPVVGILLACKAVLLTLGWQPLSLTTLVTAVVSANVFILGFLISGSLSDYKEAERLPSEIAASIDALADEAFILRSAKPDVAAVDNYVQCLADLVALIKIWFHKRASTGDVMIKIRGLNEFFAAFEPLTQANFIVRMKQEQQMLRRLILRVRTIRDVSFASTAYAISESFTTFTVIVLLLTKMSGLGESLLFMGGLSFLLIYMIALVKDLDNPFHYHSNQRGEDEVDIAPLDAVERKISSA